MASLSSFKADKSIFSQNYSSDTNDYVSIGQKSNYNFLMLFLYQ